MTAGWHIVGLGSVVPRSVRPANFAVDFDGFERALLPLGEHTLVGLAEPVELLVDSVVAVLVQLPEALWWSVSQRCW